MILLMFQELFHHNHFLFYTVKTMYLWDWFLIFSLFILIVDLELFCNQLIYYELNLI